MKILFLTITMLISNIVFAEKVPSPDLDGDGSPDWKSCAQEDKGLFCEEPIDNCKFSNPRQSISPNYFGDEDKAVGTACDLDINGDGVVNISDYSLMISKSNESWLVYSNSRPRQLPFYENVMGDMDDDGYVIYTDVCLFIERTDLGIFPPPGC